MERLKEVDVREQYQKLTEELVSKVSRIKTNVETEWINIKEGLLQTAQRTLGRMKGEEKKPWITKEILNLMEDRRTLKCSHK